MNKITHQSRFDVHVDLGLELPARLAQHRRAQEGVRAAATRRGAVLAQDAVHLGDGRHWRFRGRIVQLLERIRSRIGSKQAGLDAVFCTVVVLDLGERDQITFSCK